MSKLKHPLIVEQFFSFQLESKLYLGMEYLTGGDLRSKLQEVGKFPESTARLYLAEIMCALEYLHENSIVYRDLKLENILLDEEGHIRLVDFGLSKSGITSVDGIAEGSKANTFCGTPYYLAPEILTGGNHGKAVDFWSAGIVLYEMLAGHVPFQAVNRNQLYAQTITGSIQFPAFISKEAQSCIRGVLVRYPADRLGCGILGVLEMKQHSFFRGVSWADAESRSLKMPFLRKSKGVEESQSIIPTEIVPLNDSEDNEMQIMLQSVRPIASKANNESPFLRDTNSPIRVSHSIDSLLPHDSSQKIRLLKNIASDTQKSADGANSLEKKNSDFSSFFALFPSQAPKSNDKSPRKVPLRKWSFSDQPNSTHGSSHFNHVDAPASNSKLRRVNIQKVVDIDSILNTL